MIMREIYRENPRHWPHGLSPDMFDGGVYLVREKSAGAPVGFVGWQERRESALGGRLEKVGYYSIGIRPPYRQRGYARAAVARVLQEKAACVDRVQALIVAGNQPSLALAAALAVPVLVKAARSLFPPENQAPPIPDTPFQMTMAGVEEDDSEAGQVMRNKLQRISRAQGQPMIWQKRTDPQPWSAPPPGWSPNNPNPQAVPGGYHAAGMLGSLLGFNPQEALLRQLQGSQGGVQNPYAQNPN